MGRGNPVLVVDDDDGCRMLMVELMQRIGCTVYEAASGDEALDVAETDAPCPGDPRRRPAAVSGYEVCR